MEICENIYEIKPTIYHTLFPTDAKKSQIYLIILIIHVSHLLGHTGQLQSGQSANIDLYYGIR